MHPNPSPSRAYLAAQSSEAEADRLLERIARPAVAEMAVWPNAAAGNDPEPPHERARAWTPALWRMLVDDDRDASAANADDPLAPWPSTSALQQAARAHRARMIALLLRDGARIARGAVAHAWLRYRRRRETRAIYSALAELDDRTLRDLGFHRSEIWSVAAETSGEAEPTRMIARAPA